MQDRRSRILGDIDVTQAFGLEIGALHAPLVRRSEGRVLYVDYADAETLRANFKYENVDPSEIVETDVIWGERPLSECVPEKVDYVVASHMIEHVPDLVGWLLELHSVLKPGGLVGLAVPDLRYTFDIRRKVSTPGEMVEAYLCQYRRPSLRQVFDAAALSKNTEDKEDWDPGHSTSGLPAEVLRRLPLALDLVKGIAAEPRYVDAHCWMFTPASFLDTAEALSQMGLFPFRVERLFPTEPGTAEFQVRLRSVSGSADGTAESIAVARNMLAGPTKPGADDHARALDALATANGESEHMDKPCSTRTEKLVDAAASEGRGVLSDVAMTAEDVQQTVGEFWGEMAEKAAEQPPNSVWWLSPIVIRHINRIVCGEPIEGLHAGFHRRILELTSALPGPRHGLSIGCGHGTKEMAALELGVVETFECYEVSSVAVEGARHIARERGLADRIWFHHGDAFAAQIRSDFDLIYWNNALHHMFDAYAAVRWSYEHLRPGGVFAMDDYVGATRSQHSPEFVAWASRLMASIPEYLRRHWNGVDVLPPLIGVPDPVEQAKPDPSEMADCGAILPAIREIFPEAAIIKTGGIGYFAALTHALQNYNTETELALLNVILMADEEVSQSRVESQYAVALARKPGGPDTKAAGQHTELELAALQAAHGELEQSVAMLKGEAEALRTRVALMEASTSWTVTAPMRSLKGLATRLFPSGRG